MALACFFLTFAKGEFWFHVIKTDSFSTMLRSTTIYSQQLSSLFNAFFLAANCPAGTYHNSTMQSCNQCPRDTYQNEEGKKSCEICPTFSKTTGLGSRDVSHCISKISFISFPFTKHSFFLLFSVVLFLRGHE